MLKTARKSVLCGAIIYFGGIVAYVAYMLIVFEGSCSTLSLPGLADGGVRPCSFYEYMTESLDTPFWPYTFWHALTAGALLLLLMPCFVRITSSIFKAKSQRE
jgi:ABC-type phosphate transport system permease subunit